MSDDKVTSLAAARAVKSEDNRLWSPLDCLEEAIRDLKAGKIKADKLIVTFVDTDEQSFTVHHYSANIKASEILAALVCMNARILEEMGYT
jgi:hypothetical protein